jgi:putative ABC transport system substrate-binding protein
LPQQVAHMGSGISAKTGHREAGDVPPCRSRLFVCIAAPAGVGRLASRLAGAIGRVLAVSAPLVTASFGAAAQQPKLVRIAILTTAMSPWHTETEGFRDGLKELGYVEGQNATLVARAGQGDPVRVKALAEDLVQQSPDLLFCVSSSGAQACRAASKTVPIVVVSIGDPVRLGLAESVARPGGNLTGIANLRADLTAKRLELFKKLVPSLRRVLVTYDPREPDDVEALKVARTAAGPVGVQVLENPITEPLQMEPALAELEQGGADGILIVQSGLSLNIPGRSLEVATSNGIPTMYSHAFWPRFGALASFGPDQYAQGRQAARLAHRILTGTPAGSLPIELPDRVEFVINKNRAERLGLQLPPSILMQADVVLE